VSNRRTIYLFLLAALVLLVNCAGMTRYHTVIPGESLWRIARKYGVSIADLKKYNPKTRGRALQPQLKLYIPHENSPRFYSKELVFASRNTSSKIDWPVSGRITSYFGRRRGRKHEGMDIAAKRGTPVKAASSGRVIYSGRGIKGYGNLVVLQHMGKINTVYAHLDKRAVRKGQYVKKGRKIGAVGSTGRASGPHLHFEFRKKGRPQNPLLYLRRR